MSRPLRLILMAAGSSTRFGSAKLCVPVAGKPLYAHLLEKLALYSQLSQTQQYEALQLGAERERLVTRQEERSRERKEERQEEAKEELQRQQLELATLVPTRLLVVSSNETIRRHAHALGALCLANSRPEAGLALTIRLGLEAYPALPAEWAVFFTADQPFLSHASIQKFLATIQTCPGSILSACTETNYANPVAFAAQHFPELCALEGDTGGRKVMLAHLNSCEFFALPAAEARDIDLPSDLP